jgi:DNA-binding response OmpR family regulator
MRALIVDDDPSVSELVCRLLSAWGWECGRCGTGSEAAALARAERYDLAFCDVDLPDGDGILLAGVLRALNPRLRVVFASGEPANRLRAEQAGFEHFLDKPFTREELGDALARLDERRVLLVEDDPVQSAEYRRALELEGLWVTAVDNAEDAIALAESFRFRAILADNVLPGMTGLQALPRLRASGAPVVMMSRGPGAEADALLLGAAAFLKKPFSRGELGAAVRKAWAEKAA